MISITVYLAASLLCISDVCYPALVGKETPIGQYQLRAVKTTDSGYGGSVLAFHEDPHGLFAIHRPWLERPYEKREERLAGKGSRVITAGCINVANDVYGWLENNCSTCSIEVLP